jgi:hypothetical protein
MKLVPKKLVGRVFLFFLLFFPFFTTVLPFYGISFGAVKRLERELWFGKANFICG